MMTPILQIAGSLAGSAGAVVCLAAGVTRLMGHYAVFGYELRTIFIVGIALMVFGCFAKLQAGRRG